MLVAALPSAFNIKNSYVPCIVPCNSEVDQEANLFPAVYLQVDAPGFLQRKLWYIEAALKQVDIPLRCQ